MAQSIFIPELPRFVPPMLAKPGVPFDSPEHLFEIKWDGTAHVPACFGPRSTSVFPHCLAW